MMNISFVNKSNKYGKSSQGLSNIQPNGSQHLMKPLQMAKSGKMKLLTEKWRLEQDI